eukprot:gene29501-38604_t
MSVKPNNQQEEKFIWIPDIKHEWILALLTDIRSINDLTIDDRIVVSLPQSLSVISYPSQGINQSSPLLKRVVKFGDTILAEKEELQFPTRRSRNLCSTLIFSEPAVLQILRHSYHGASTEANYFSISDSPPVLLVIDSCHSPNTDKPPRLDSKEGTEKLVDFDNFQLCISDIIAPLRSPSDHAGGAFKPQLTGSDSLHTSQETKTVVMIGNSSRDRSLFITAHRVAATVLTTAHQKISPTSSLPSKNLYEHFKVILEAFAGRKSPSGDGYESLCATAVTIHRPVTTAGFASPFFTVDAILFGSCDGLHGTTSLSTNEEIDSEIQIFSFLRHGLSAMVDVGASMSSRLGKLSPRFVGGAVRQGGEQLGQVRAALEAFGVTAEELQHIWQLLIALLHLSHIHVGATATMGAGFDAEDYTGLIDITCDTLPLEEVAQLLGLFRDQLILKLTTDQTLLSGNGGEHYQSRILSSAEVQGGLTLLTRWLYRRLFDWIVRKINESRIGRQTEDSQFSDSWVRVVCPCLDEIRTEASIENLLSEYGRIRMENMFYEEAVSKELSFYKEQGVSLPDSYHSSSHQELGYHRNNRLLEESFHSLLTWLESDNLTFELTLPDNTISFEKRDTVECFTVRHYGDREVRYAVADCRNRNKVELTESLASLLAVSTNPFVRTLTQMRPEESLSNRARNWLEAALAAPAHQTNPNPNLVTSQHTMTYVACISPSASSTHFDSTWVLKQMRKLEFLSMESALTYYIRGLSPGAANNKIFPSEDAVRVTQLAALLLSPDEYHKPSWNQLIAKVVDSQVRAARAVQAVFRGFPVESIIALCNAPSKDSAVEADYSAVWNAYPVTESFQTFQ